MQNPQPLSRVVVTGLGAITPIGNTVEEYWQGLVDGKNGITEITRFDTTDHECRVGGEVKDFDPLAYVPAKEARRMDRFAQFGVSASIQALRDANLEITPLNAPQIGVLLGTGIGGLQVLEDQHEIIRTKGPSRCSPFMIPMMIGNMAAGLTAIHTGAQGPNSCTVTACAAGSNAIGDAFRLVQSGFAQAMICGGTEAAITPLGFAGFASARAMSRRNDDPAHASRPFDKDRDGFVMGEGAGILIIENGYITPEMVDYINAHGTSTSANDSTETKAIKKVLGDHAYKVAVSSTKSMTGHLLGGSGGIEAVATVLAVKNNIAPPTMNLENPDSDCDLDYVPNQSRPMTINVATSNSFGFGGHNVTLVFKKYRNS